MQGQKGIAMIAVTKTYLPDKDKLFTYINQIYSSCQLTNHGLLVQELENRLARYLGVRNLVLVANGTLALQVAYKALNIRGSAITTPFSFPATTSSLVWESIKPIFVDIDPGHLNMDCKKIEEAIKVDTSAIVPVHVFGNACEVEAIHDIALRHNLKVIYDGAHAFGVNYKGESLLNWGDITTLSFHATKLFHTVEGGAIITNDDVLAKKIRLMINFGIAGPGNVIELGINAKMSEFHAAMGLCVLDEIEHISRAREKIWNYYYELLKDSVSIQSRNEHCTNNHSYFPVLFKNEYSMQTIKDNLSEQEILARQYFYPSLDTLPYITSEQKKVARNIAGRILCLPLHSNLELNIVKKICNVLNESISYI